MNSRIFKKGSILLALGLGVVNCNQGAKLPISLSGSSQSSSSTGTTPPLSTPTPTPAPTSTPQPPTPTPTVTPTPSPTPHAGAPSAVTNLQVVNQGGADNLNNPLTNYQKITWNAASPGSNAIAYYQIYRNGVAYDKTKDPTTLSYADSNAPMSNDPTFALAATTYSYQVAAVDTAGNAGPLAAQMSVYYYQNGQSNISNRDLSWGGASCLQEDYSSTGGNPQNGSFNIFINYICGGFQPESWAPLAPPNDLELGAFNYLTVDVNPQTLNIGALKLGMVSMIKPGVDTFGYHGNPNIFNYGPAPVVGKWTTYKVPLTDAAIGVCDFTGTINGTTLTLQGTSSCNQMIDAGGYIVGANIPAGTQVVNYGNVDTTTGLRPFTLAGPGISSGTHIASQTMTFRRTSLYKMALFPDNGGGVYFNNLGFSATNSPTR